MYGVFSKLAVGALFVLSPVFGSVVAFAQEKILPISALLETTGAIAYAGLAIQKGVELGLEEVNQSDRLRGYKLVVDFKDNATQPATSAALASQISQSNSLAILGPALSNDGLATAPIAQRQGIPLILIQANTPGLVESGEYIYRVTAALNKVNALTIDYLKEQGVKTLAMSYPTDISSTSELARVDFPKWADAAGIKVVASEGSPKDATDFSVVISKLVAQKPEAIGLVNLDTQLPSLIGGLRRAGYTGYIFTHFISTQSLQAAGDAANGTLASLDFSPAMTGDSSGAFIKAYTKKFGVTPTSYNANGYDAVLFVAEALQKIVSTGQMADRKSLLKALQEVSLTGFKGATGIVTFDDKYHRDARVPGVVVKYTNAAPEVVKTGK